LQAANRHIAFALREKGLVVFLRRVLRGVGRFRAYLAGMAGAPSAERLPYREQGNIAAHLVREPDGGIILCATRPATRCNPDNLPADLADGTIASSCHVTALSHHWSRSISADFSLELSAVEPQPGENWGDRVREAVIAAGFKVEERKAPIEVTVVDRCERPSEN
jgi:hypothetical protein